MGLSIGCYSGYFVRIECLRRRASGILCDQRISLRVKGKVHKTVGSKTSNYVRCPDVGSEESTREEVGCGGNEDVRMDQWSHQAGQN